VYVPVLVCVCLFVRACVFTFVCRRVYGDFCVKKGVLACLGVRVCLCLYVCMCVWKRCVGEFM